MERLLIDRSLSDSTSLALYIDDLDPNKQYEGFRLRIKAGTWLDGSSFCFKGLEPYTIYKAFGQYKLSGTWYDIPPTAFVTYPSSKELGKPSHSHTPGKARNAPAIGSEPKKVSVSVLGV